MVWAFLFSHVWLDSKGDTFGHLAGFTYLPLLRVVYITFDTHS